MLVGRSASTFFATRILNFHCGVHALLDGYILAIVTFTGLYHTFNSSYFSAANTPLFIEHAWLLRYNETVTILRPKRLV